MTSKRHLNDLEIITDIEAFDALRPVWNELADSFATPLLRHEWFSCIAKAFYEPNALSVVILQEGGKLKAAAPLVAHKSNGLRQLEIIGAPFLSEPSGLLYRDREALDELLRVVVRTTSASTRLHRIERGSQELSALPAACRGRGVMLQGAESAAPLLPISGSWSDFESSLTSRQRSDIRRARRRAEKNGKIEIDFVNPSPEETEALLKETDDVERRSWKGNNASSKKSNFHRFRKLYARKAAEEGLLRIGVLRVDGQAISSMTAIVFKGAFWVLKVEYDSAYAKSSPGILLMHDSIRYSFENGLQRYEFLGNDEPWMHVWTNETRTFQSPYIIPFSPLGTVALTARLAAPFARRLRSIANRN